MVARFARYWLAVSSAFAVTWFGLHGLAMLHDRFGTIASFAILSVVLAAAATTMHWFMHRRPFC